MVTGGWKVGGGDTSLVECGHDQRFYCSLKVDDHNSAGGYSRISSACHYLDGADIYICKISV